MEIKVVEIKSAITPIDRDSVRSFFSEIENAGDLSFRFVSPEEFKDADFGLIYIATGGTEGIFLREFENFKNKPCFLLTSGASNSLAASMEILSWLKSHEYKGEILHGNSNAVAARINTLYRVEKARVRLKGMKVGWLGGSSDWLIDSVPDPEAYHELLGMDVVNIEMNELIEETKKGGYEPNEWTARLLSMGYDEAEMQKALDVYGALKRICVKYELGAVTVRCFDLLNTVYTTGCLALAILNAEGIYAGCEGDMPSLVSMIILGEVSQQPVFMCNLNRIDTASNEMVFAHCTLPMNMPVSMTLKTHYESGIGVAIAGVIPQKRFTIFKVSGDLSQCFIHEGDVIENLHEESLCRTQIRVHLHHYEYFLTDPIANHHCIVTGSYQSALQEFFASL